MELARRSDETQITFVERVQALSLGILPAVFVKGVRYAGEDVSEYEIPDFGWQAKERRVERVELSATMVC